MVNPGQELSSIDFRNLIGGPLRAAVEAQSDAALATVNFIKNVGFKPGSSTDPDATDTGEPVYVAFKYPKEVAPYQPAVGDADNPTALPPHRTDVVTITADGTKVVTGSNFLEEWKTSGKATWEGQSTAVAITALDLTASPQTMTLAKVVPATVSILSIEMGVSAYPAGRPAYVAARPAQFQEMKIEVPILTIVPIPYLRIEEMTLDFNAKINSMEYQSTSSEFNIAGSLEIKQRWPSGSAKLNVSASYQRKTNQGSTVERTYSLAIHVRAVQDELPAGMERVLGILEESVRSQPSAAPAPAHVGAIPA